jgi:hypothetical protein
MILSKISMLLSAISFILVFYLISNSERALLFAIPVFFLELSLVAAFDEIEQFMIDQKKRQIGHGS